MGDRPGPTEGSHGPLAPTLDSAEPHTFYLPTGRSIGHSKGHGGGGLDVHRRQCEQKMFLLISKEAATRTPVQVREEWLMDDFKANGRAFDPAAGVNSLGCSSEPTADWPMTDALTRVASIAPR